MPSRRRSRARLAEAIVDAVSSPLLVLDGQLQVLSANRAYGDRFGGEPGQTVGHGVFDIEHRRWDLPALHELLETPWLPGPGVAQRQADVQLPSTSGGRVRLDVRRVARQAGDTPVLLLSITAADAAAPRASKAAKAAKVSKAPKGA